MKQYIFRIVYTYHNTHKH